MLRVRFFGEGICGNSQLSADAHGPADFIAHVQLAVQFVHAGAVENASLNPASSR